MHSNGKPHSIKYTKRVLEKAFKKPFDEIFDDFDETPMGIGAVAQASDDIDIASNKANAYLAGIQSSPETDGRARRVFGPKARYKPDEGLAA